MLKKEQKTKLRKIGHGLRPLFQIGKDGVKDTLITSLNDSLTAHELVKVGLLKTSPIEVQEAAIELSRMTKSEVVYIVGHTVLLYRKSDKNKMGL